MQNSNTDIEINPTDDRIVENKKYKLVVSKHEGEKVSIEEETFFTYMTRVRATFANFVLAGTSMSERIDTLIKSKTFSQTELNNIKADKEKLEKACDVAAKFNVFMMNYEEIRMKFYQYYQFMGLLNTEENEKGN